MLLCEVWLSLQIAVAVAGSSRTAPRRETESPATRDLERQSEVDRQTPNAVCTHTSPPPTLSMFPD